MMRPCDFCKGWDENDDDAPCSNCGGIHACKFQAKSVKNVIHQHSRGVKEYRAEITFVCLLCGGVKTESIPYPVRRCVK